jgi:hypothetical protein
MSGSGLVPSPRTRLLAWGAAACVALIVLVELLVVDAGLAWVAEGYLGGGAVTFDGALIAGATLSLLITWKLLLVALRAERAYGSSPDVI